MEHIKKTSKQYFSLLKERAKLSRVYTSHQSTGLALAQILNDPSHKSLYMRLAKMYDNAQLTRIAKNIEECADIKNKGAYFMKVLKATDLNSL
ncbi:MAG: hypothetical protein A3I89_03155 [Candidatus Harrisonbacteria bacterium RIFCSPLOWO2_02_FULL_41_11]|uniref:Uncharacterized protein n=1 Tax=Candidatus Harrisonbacteria bacterium RIFCSPHIGHO2_02_FULL_42_16 TaxID=1798404 RepID=A0A1G1ZIL0_9BACT|nr:MAG: hypothetical protein A3B92_02645 [Candidatus Harrisonbacteria bacterium RIFCSPHIGHO2_02_FULL_42_16]OGY66236.1 MAG: hypothetical protein A3I89_03155 [Candidatus Harrisonbacteria bacterium RIFCSPLOWO2_02_FULL_41_11]